MNLQYLSDEMKDDPEIVLHYVSENYCMIYYASDRLKQDKEFIRQAYSIHPYTVMYVSYHVKQDIDFMKSLITITPFNTDTPIKLSCLMMVLCGVGPKTASHIIYSSMIPFNIVYEIMGLFRNDCVRLEMLMEYSSVHEHKQKVRSSKIHEVLDVKLPFELTTIITGFTIDRNDILMSGL